jgi:hypothetical protein
MNPILSRLLTGIIGGIVGVIYSVIICTILAQIINQNFPPQGTFNSPELTYIILLLFGSIFGGIIGVVIGIFQKGIINSMLIGLYIAVATEIIIFFLTRNPNIGGSGFYSFKDVSSFVIIIVVPILYALLCSSIVSLICNEFLKKFAKKEVLE